MPAVIKRWLSHVSAGPAKPIWTAAALLVLLQGGVWWIGRTGIPDKFILPDRKLAELPLILGDWTGKDADVDPQIFLSAGAHSVVNRRYRDPYGRAIILHSALFTNHNEMTPHRPDFCYAGDGWQLTGEQIVPLMPVNGSTDRQAVAARLLTLERSGQRVLALYWYQLGDQVFVDRNGARDARQHLWGRDAWPPVIKVLVEISAPELPPAEKQLRQFADLVYGWTADL